MSVVYDTKVEQGKNLTNGSSMKFDEQNFDEFILVFIGKVLQKKG